jgi:hypothetical protein
MAPSQQGCPARFQPQQGVGCRQQCNKKHQVFTWFFAYSSCLQEGWLGLLLFSRHGQEQRTTKVCMLAGRDLVWAEKPLCMHV